MQLIRIDFLNSKFDSYKDLMNIAPKRISNKKLTDLANNSSPAKNGRSNDNDYRNQVNKYSQIYIYEKKYIFKI